MGTIIFEGRNEADARGEASCDPIQVVWNEVTAVTARPEANQWEPRSYWAKRMEKVVAVGLVARPQVDQAESKHQSIECTTERFGDRSDQESLDAPQKASWESDHREVLQIQWRCTSFASGEQTSSLLTVWQTVLARTSNRRRRTTTVDF
jgi:hypothetical protein